MGLGSSARSFLKRRPHAALVSEGGGVKSPEAGAGVPAPPLVQVSASVLCKEQGGLSCVLGLRLGA